MTETHGPGYASRRPYLAPRQRRHFRCCTSIIAPTRGRANRKRRRVQAVCGVRLILVGVYGFVRRAGTLALPGGPRVLFVGRLGAASARRAAVRPGCASGSHDFLPQPEQALGGEFSRPGSRSSHKMQSCTRKSDIMKAVESVGRMRYDATIVSWACAPKRGRQKTGLPIRISYGN